MKKIIALILALVLCIGLLDGCGSTNDTPPVDSNTPSVEQPSGTPHIPPSEEPSTEPSEEPSPEPSGEPSPEPSPEPSEEPSPEPSEEPSQTPDDSPYGVVTVQDGNFGTLTFDRACIASNCIYVEPGSNVTVARDNNDFYSDTDNSYIYLYVSYTSPQNDGSISAIIDYGFEFQLTVTNGCVDDMFSQLSGYSDTFPIVMSRDTIYILIPDYSGKAYNPSSKPSDEPAAEPSVEPSAAPSPEPAERTYGTLTVEDINAGFLTFDRACLEGNIVYIEAGSNVTAKTIRAPGEYGYIGPDALVIFTYPVIQGDEIRVKDYTYEDFFASDMPVFTGCVDDMTNFISSFDVPMLPVIITMEDDPLILVIE